MGKLIGVVLLLVIGVIALNYINAHPVFSPRTHDQSVTTDGASCDSLVQESGGPTSPGTPQLDPQKLCGALQDAEATADCLGDWQPPVSDRVNARQFCIEVEQRGCGTPGRNCNDIPTDQTYYHHH